MTNIDTLLKKQGKVTPYLDLIEKNTLKAVTYASMNVDISSQLATIKMDGKGSSYSTVVQQMELYRKLPDVKGVKLSGARTGATPADGVIFSIEITLNRS